MSWETFVTTHEPKTPACSHRAPTHLHVTSAFLSTGRYGRKRWMDGWRYMDGNRRVGEKWREEERWKRRRDE